MYSLKTKHSDKYLTNRPQLLNIRVGPGAAILPKNVSRLHLDFAVKDNNGHVGARKFWRNALPRLKYHNPAVSMTIHRSTNQEAPSLLTIYFKRTPASQSLTSPALSAPATATTNQESSNRTEVIDMRNIRDSEILSKLLYLTQATPVAETLEDKMESQELADIKEKIERDKIAGASIQEEKRKEKALLDAVVKA